jgi:hypothetical protein
MMSRSIVFIICGMICLFVFPVYEKYALPIELITVKVPLKGNSDEIRFNA